MFFLIFKFLFFFISWRLITLQYCSGFCHTLTRISHGIKMFLFVDDMILFLYTDNPKYFTKQLENLILSQDKYKISTDFYVQAKKNGAIQQKIKSLGIHF